MMLKDMRFQAFYILCVLALPLTLDTGSSKVGEHRPPLGYNTGWFNCSLYLANAVRAHGRAEAMGDYYLRLIPGPENCPNGRWLE